MKVVGYFTNRLFARLLIRNSPGAGRSKAAEVRLTLCQPKRYRLALFSRNARMHLIAPDLLVEAKGLSFPITAMGIAFGVLLWLFGWRWHRFWVVLFTTVLAGIYGLNLGQFGGPRTFAIGLLLAVSAGMLAIDLSRFIAFASSGIGCGYIVPLIVPAFHEPLICFLIGGILGILLYRFQLMLLSSFIGAIITVHCALLMAETLTRDTFVAADWVRSHSIALNITIIVLALVGLAVQGQLERWREEKPDRDRDRAMSSLSDNERSVLESFQKRWFNWGGFRRSA
jgi:hypothetical protein